MKSSTRIFLIALLAVFFFTSAAATVPDAYAQSTKKTTASKQKIKPSVSKPTSKMSASKRKAKKSRASRTRGSAVNYEERFAALVVDADTGRILYEKNSTARRYPASLTKMMTLYLIFDALRAGKINMSTSWVASGKAAVQPPTNISLDVGDRVPVRTVIEALIVRSANDAAMLAAESLGGSQAGFAAMMNKKARELGMRNTVYYNPSGLPDTRQVSTAQDLAKLGIALRRDFPEYFDYFNTRSFNWNGRTYEGHNRLLGRYPGADGIKTGYINASGYNLVTSVTRGGRHYVGVVLGGRTGASRDQEMMAMLDRTFLQLARGAVPKQGSVSPASVKTASKAPEPESRQQADSAADENSEVDTAPDTQEQPAVTAAPKPASNPFDSPPASASPAASSPGWGVQVGAFPQEGQAYDAAMAAQKIAKSDLSGAKVRIQSALSDGSRKIYRSRLGGLSQAKAESACRILQEKKRQCMMYQE